MQTDIRHFFELLWGMTEKELRARYKYTAFGFLWLVVNPILQMLIIGFVFSFVMKNPIQFYYYHLFIGLLVWNFFSSSLTKTTPSIVFERSLIRKSYFPRAVIPLSIIFSNAVNFCVALILFLVPVAFIHTMTIFTLLTLTEAIVLLLLFTIGFSLLTCALNVRFRDINFFTQALLIIWFYATPIVYSLKQIPDHFLWLWRLNPLTSIIQLFQHALLGGQPPDSSLLTANIVVLSIIANLGIVVFQEEGKTFDDWI